MSDGNAEAHACICNKYNPTDISSRKFGQDVMYYITTGIYRCTIPDMNMKFCENFRVSRISADKRFRKLILRQKGLYQQPDFPPSIPLPGF